MNKNLTPEQKHILHEEGTEPSGSSPLNYEKRKGDYYCVGCGTKLFESNRKYESGTVGLLFLMHYQMCLKLKSIIQLDLREQSITVKSAVDIMDIFLMMVQNLLVKDIATMDCVWFLLQKNK